MVSVKQFIDYTLLGLLFYALKIVSGTEDSDFSSYLRLFQTFNGRVGAENFTYYQLKLKGHVIIKLESVEGDADLYASSSTLLPTWENYSMKSDTCSIDYIVVEKVEKRPIGIGVYGHIHWPMSTFRLSIYVDDHAVDYSSEKESNDHKEESTFSNVNEEKEEGSILWDIFWTILRVILDGLL